MPSKQLTVGIQPPISDEKVPDEPTTEIEELQLQLGKIKYEVEAPDIFRSEWTVEEDMFILRNFEVKQISPKKCEKLYESAQTLQPKSFTKMLSHEDLTKRHEDLKTPELSSRRSLLLRFVLSRCSAEDAAAAETELRRQVAEEERRQADSPVARQHQRSSIGEVSASAEVSAEDMVQVLVVDELRCPTRLLAGRRALRASPVLRGMLQSAPPPRPPDYRPEIVLDAAADGFSSLRPYGIIEVVPEGCAPDCLSAGRRRFEHVRWGAGMRSGGARVTHGGPYGGGALFPGGAGPSHARPAPARHARAPSFALVLHMAPRACPSSLPRAAQLVHRSISATSGAAHATARAQSPCRQRWWGGARWAQEVGEAVAHVGDKRNTTAAVMRHMGTCQRIRGPVMRHMGT